MKNKDYLILTKGRAVCLVLDTAIKHTNKWIKWVKFGAEVIDPTSLLKFAWL